MEESCFVYIWKKSRFQLTGGYGREVGKFISHISRKGCGRKSIILQTGKMFLGKSVYKGSCSQAIPFQSDRRERHMQERKKVLGLENKRGIPHRYQPLHSIPPTAEPVLIHSGDDTQHFPTLEAQLVRSCSGVVTESTDCPVGSQTLG